MNSLLTFLRLIIAEARRFPEIGQVWYTRGPLAACQYVAAYLAQQQASGTKLNAAPEVAAQHFLFGNVERRVLPLAITLPAVPHLCCKGSLQAVVDQRRHAHRMASVCPISRRPPWPANPSAIPSRTTCSPRKTQLSSSSTISRCR
ncbi:MULTISPECIES: TetR/AcrR family transcriptional regulator C-terminal domain-containing protein [Cupriavidus]|uniref:TetR/AcrR family transcriptional regulator C-terminal domain-containing protein n=1 Tax=Cupriavidus TaxID=106589 RepID=UPI001F29B46B|nr:MULTISPECIES: TetR/AcrR family transcriptional regulator C-terminal domain-containing protein [Cupriavidus]